MKIKNKQKQEYIDDYLRMEKLNKRKKREELDKIAKPSLIKRYFSAALDGVFIFIVSLLMMTLFYKTLFKPLGYYDYVQEARNVLIESNLYQQTQYDELVTIEYDAEIYDQRIKDYYQNDSYALSKEKLEEYNNAKIESKLYQYNENNELVLVDNVDNNKVKEFLTQQYNNAISFLKTNSMYISNTNKSFMVVYLMLLLTLFIVTSIFYLFIPLLRKDGESLSQIIFKICLVDRRDNSTVKRWQILVRYLIILGFDYLLTMILYVYFGSFMFLPLLISIFMIGFTKTNSGPQDYLSNTYLTTKSRSDSFEVLKSIQKMK